MAKKIYTTKSAPCSRRYNNEQNRLHADGVSLDEISEWIVENTDFIPEEIISEIYSRAVFG